MRDIEHATQAEDLPRVEAATDSFARRWLTVLEAVSLLYMLLPGVIFITGYLRITYAAPLCVLMLLSTWTAFTSARGEIAVTAPKPPRLYRRKVLIIAALTFFMVACTGIGAFTLQFFDYVATNALLRDYIQYTLPLAYQSGPDDGPFRLVMYSAYWLPAAMVGKVLGWYVACYAHYLWAAFGLFLVVCWFMYIVGSLRVGLAFLLLFFGGLDIVGRLLSEGGPTAANVSWWDYLTGVFWWGEGRGWLDHWSSGFALTDPEYSAKAGGVFFRFFSPISYMVDGPQHIVPPIIGFMMILHDLWRRKNTGRVLFIWSLFPLCSVFTAAGSLPFLVLGLVETRCRNLLTLANVTAIPVFFVLVSYIASTQKGGGGVLVSGWVWQFQDLSDTAWMLMLHYIVEFGLLALLIPTLRQAGYMPSPFWYLGAMTMFLLAPFYRMGTYNDFSSKIIVPAQMVFILLLAMAMLRASTPSQRLRRGLVIALLLIGAIGPAGTIIRALDFGMTGTPPPWKSVRHVNQWEPKRLLMQGRGDPETFFWKHLAKQPVFQPTDPIYPALYWNFVELKEPISNWIFFVEQDKYATTKDGLTIRTKGNQPILRRDNMNLAADTVGQIKVNVSVLVDGKPAENAAIIAIWATDEQIANAETNWPFERWHTNQAWPVRSIVTANSYWRGNIGAMAFYLRVPQGDEREYEVIIRDISFLER